MSTQTIRILLIVLAVFASTTCPRAATITKANNADDLNLASSWTNGVVPGPLDVARWDFNVTGANAVALGADQSWSGIIVTNNPGGPVFITPGNTLTLGTNGIDMSRLSQDLIIGADLTLGPGLQRWNVTNASTLTVGGTLTRSANATLVKGVSTLTTANQGTVMVSPPLLNDVVPWATVQSSGAAANGSSAGNTFATVSGSDLVAYTGATLVNTSGTGVSFGGIPTGDNSTINYDLGVASVGGSMTSDTYVNTLRNIGGSYTQPGTATFRANAIMNAGTGALNIATPVQQADTTVNELVVAPWTSGITISNVISDNSNPLKLTITGTNNGAVIVSAQNTFSGGVTINTGGRLGIRASSTPTNGTATSGPLGTGTITLNGGTLYAASANYAVANPIVVGPAGGQLQMNGATPDLHLMGNVTGSGTLIIAGVFNQNGLFLSGDNSAFDGTVIVTGSNNRLGTGASGSALARWVVNGALQARVVGGDTYHLGELSSTATTGGLVGWAGNLSPAIQEFVVGALNTSSTYSGVMSNNASGNAATGNSDAAANNIVALTKVGTGTLTLIGTCNNTGPFTIRGGSLQLGNGGSGGTFSPNCTIALESNANFTISKSSTMGQGTNFSRSPITGTGSFTQAGTGTTIFTTNNTYAGDTLVSSGTLLVNGSIAGTATVMSGAKLGGNGAIGDVITVQAGGQLGAGPGGNVIGTLTLDATPVLGGSVLAKINAGSAQADKIEVTGGSPINYGGSLVVSNVGAPLLAGDSFTLFTAATHNGSFDSIVGSPGAGLAYSFTNGVLSVVSTVASDPTNITASLSSDLSGNTLTLAWPSSHLGWLLQSQTNNVDGSLTNDPAAWFDRPGSTLVNLLSITNPSDLAVYFRMKYVAPPPPSNAPTILTARATNSAVALTWSAPPFARTYNLMNSTVSGGPYNTVANVVGTGYTNTGLANSTTYYFVVSAVNQNGETANSAETNATPIAVPPLAPTGLAAQAAHGQVQLSWNAAATATNYYVKRGTTSGGPYTIITNVVVTGFLDTNVVDGTTYYYVVSGLNIDGEGPNSSQVSATPTATPPAVPIPTATGQYTQVKVTWPVVFGAASYNVKSATSSGGPYTTITNTSATTLYDPGLSNGATYYYVVSALNDIGESADSSEVSATTTTTIPLVYDLENTAAGYPTPPLPPLGDPNLAFIPPLPDPFCWANDPTNGLGSRSTNFSDWKFHRAEIKAQIENYEIGYKPPVDPSMISASISGSGTSRTLTVIVTNVVGTNRTLTITCAMTLPASSGSFPAIIGMNSANGSISLGGRAIATINYQHNQVTTYGSQQATDPYYRLYAAPYSPALDTINTGQYSAWAWGVSRILDGLHKLNGNLGGGASINLERIGVTGCSYAGKMALFCGALDERIALTIPQESGGGGAPNWRYSATEPAGSVEWLPNTDHNWFRESMFAFGNTNDVSYLPEDHHMLMAMVAPRALFATGNPDGAVWLSNPSCYVSCRAAERVYEMFGVSDRLGWNINGGKSHCARTADLDTDVYAFLDKFLLGMTNVNTITNRHVPGSYSSINYARWTQWWGTTNAILP